jgi:hypothetical protein
MFTNDRKLLSPKTFVQESDHKKVNLSPNSQCGWLSPWKPQSLTATWIFRDLRTGKVVPENSSRLLSSTLCFEAVRQDLHLRSDVWNTVVITLPADFRTQNLPTSYSHSLSQNGVRFGFYIPAENLRFDMSLFWGKKYSHSVSQAPIFGVNSSGLILHYGYQMRYYYRHE